MHDPAAVTAWATAWTCADLLWVVVLARLGWRWLDHQMVTRPSPPRAIYVAGASVAVTLILLVTGSFAGLVNETSADLQAAKDLVTGCLVPLLAALLVGCAGIRRRVHTRAVFALLAALGLDTLAGQLGERDMFGGPARLQLLPTTDGVWSTTMSILLLTVVTTTACLTLVALGPAARALRALQNQPRVGLLLALAANTVDALATSIGLRIGTMAEANPLVRASGLGLKWVVVTAFIVLLYRLRPALVWIAAAAYLLVASYHLVGALLLA